jgi:signal transduction histidine kinase
MRSKILFIDDEKEILEAYKELFIKNEENTLDNLLQELELDGGNEISSSEEIEYQTDFATQGLEGFTKIKQALEFDEPFNIAFIDMRMPPGINGAETAKKIRQIDPEIEIVFVTAYSDIDMKKVVNDTGFPDKLLYLKKPFDSQEVKQLALNLTHKYHSRTIKDRFLSNVTHELKTPLASILGFSSLIDSEDDMSEIKEFNQIITKNAQLMKQLIDDLLSSVTGSKSKVFKEKVLLTPLLDHIFSMFYNNAHSKGISLNLNIEQDDYIWADKNKILQCIVNLVSNALKFTEKGFININLIKENNTLKLSVQDSGLGIDKDYTELIFKRFMRIEDTHHNIPGFGLGLSIVKEIVDLHEAKITVDSQLGSGSTFTIDFQICD